MYEKLKPKLEASKEKHWKQLVGLIPKKPRRKNRRQRRREALKPPPYVIAANKVRAPDDIGYVEYIASEWWNIKRKARIRLSGCKCDRCGANDCELQAHHRHYKTLGKEQMTDLETLCVPCHKKHHGVTEEVPVVSS